MLGIKWEFKVKSSVIREKHNLDDINQSAKMFKCRVEDRTS